MQAPQQRQAGHLVIGDYTEEELQQRWRDEVAPAIDNLMERVTSTAPVVQRGSVLYADEHWAEPFKSSTAFWLSMSATSDHLHALKLLVWEANVHHTYAPYTLARAAIEAASTAVWLLSPETREERVLRALRWYAQNFRDECRALNDEQQRDKWLGRIKDTALARGLDTSAATRKLTTTEVVEGADSLIPGTHTAWQAFSGMAHSRMWAPMGLLETEVLSRDKGTTTTKMTSGSAQLLWAAKSALFVAVEAARLWRERAEPRLPRPETPIPEAFGSRRRGNSDHLRVAAESRSSPARSQRDTLKAPKAGPNAAR